jgi:hypothetical protein
MDSETSISNLPLEPCVTLLVISIHLAGKNVCQWMALLASHE